MNEIKPEKSVNPCFMGGDKLMYHTNQQVMIMKSHDYFQKRDNTFKVPEGIKLISPFQLSNILFLVSFKSQSFVKIFQIDKNKIIGEISFPSNVINIKMLSK
jgi:hypothetical protein